MKKKTVKGVKMHKFLVCAYKSQDFARSPISGEDKQKLYLHDMSGFDRIIAGQPLFIRVKWQHFKISLENFEHCDSDRHFDAWPLLTISHAAAGEKHSSSELGVMWLTPWWVDCVPVPGSPWLHPESLGSILQPRLHPPESCQLCKEGAARAVSWIGSLKAPLSGCWPR